MTTYLPIRLDLDSALERLAREEQEWTRRLAELEGRVRGYEDRDKPAFQSWMRLEFGPQLSTLEELFDKIRERRILARRVQELVERKGLHPREALHVASAHEPEPEEDTHAQEVEARRQAKREAKRSARREARRQTTPKEHSSARKGVLALYRALARRLHPDSPTRVRSLAAERIQALWLEVQAAYKALHLERLMAVLAWLEQHGGDRNPETAPPALTLSERHDRLNALRESCARRGKHLDELATEPAWGFRESSGAARKKLRKRLARELEEEMERVQEALAALEDFIESIGPPRKPGRRSRLS